MKSKRRHELQHNTLDAELAKLLAFVKKRGSVIFWVVMIALATVLAVKVVGGWSREKRDNPRAEYANIKMDARRSAAGPDEVDELLERLRELTEQQDNKSVAALACVDAGDIASGMFLDLEAKLAIEQREQYGKKAEKFYRKAVDDFPEEPLAVAKARVGLAKLAEGRADMSTARAQYEAILAIPEMAGQPVRRRATEGLAMLKVLEKPVRMATTAPSDATTGPSETRPASRPTTSQPD